MSHCRWIERALAVASLLVAGLLPLGSRPVRAQTLAPDSRLTTLLTSAANRRWYVRLTMAGESVFTGTATSTSGGAVRIEGRDLEVEGIRLLERRVVEGSGTKPGALAGGFVFGLAGMGLVAIGCGISESSSCGGGDILLGAAVGAAFGGTLGGIVGGLTRPGEYLWIREWPAAPPERNRFRD